MKEITLRGKDNVSLVVGLRHIWLNQRTFWWAAVMAGIIWAAAQAGLWSRPLVNTGGWTLVLRLLNGLVHPRLDVAFLQLILESTLVTLAYAVCGTVLSLLIGFMGGILSSEVWWQSQTRNSQPKGLAGSGSKWATKRGPWLVVRGMLAVPRAVHEVVWELFFVSILGLVPLTAVLAIAIPFGAICAKVFSEILDEQPRQPFYAILNSGASPSQAFLYSLIPQALPDLISYAFYRFECSIRSATVLGLIGAGGLGYQILLSLQSLRYEEMLPIIVALFFLCGITDIWSASLRRRIGGSSRIELNWSGGNQPLRKISKVPEGSKNFIRFSLILTLGLSLFSFVYLKPDFASLFSQRTNQLLADIFKQSFPPRFPSEGIGEIVHLSEQTLSISILAMTVATCLAIPSAFWGAQAGWLRPGSGKRQFNQARGNREMKYEPLVVLVRGLLLVARAVPTPIWALIFLFVLFPGVLPGAIALGIHNWGISGRLMAESVENMNEKPLLALQGQGASQSQVVLYGAFPAVLPSFVSYILYRWENCLRETVIVGMVGAGGLGRLLSEQLSSFDYGGLVITLLVLIGMTFVVDMISASMRSTMR